MLKVDLIDLLKDLIKKEGITNLEFATRLNVPPATISHLLSGRNRPSLDFIQKLIRTYPQLNLYELLDLEEYENSKTINHEKKSEGPVSPTGSASDYATKNQEIQKIVIFYKDNRFEEYNRKQS